MLSVCISHASSRHHAGAARALLRNVHVHGGKRRGLAGGHLGEVTHPEQTVVELCFLAGATGGDLYTAGVINYGTDANRKAKGGMKV